MQLQGGSIELAGSYKSWEAVSKATSKLAETKKTTGRYTISTLAGMMQVPSAHGVFLYDTNRANAGCRGIGFLIQPAAN